MESSLLQPTGKGGFGLQGYELEVPKAHVKLNTPMMPDTNDATVFDWFFDKTAAEWRLWSSSVPAATIQDDAKFSDIFIPTVDSVRYTFLLDLAVRHHQPFLFVGPTGDKPLLPPFYFTRRCALLDVANAASVWLRSQNT